MSGQTFMFFLLVFFFFCTNTKTTTTGETHTSIKLKIGTPVKQSMVNISTKFWDNLT